MRCKHCGREIVRITWAGHQDDWVDKIVLEDEIGQKLKYLKRPIPTVRNMICMGRLISNGYHEPYLFTEYYKQLNLCI